jgi:hypothetical protein
MAESAADRLAALDFTPGDSPSVEEIGAVGFRWPEPGQSCLCEDATAQLYWPKTGPKGEADAA